MILLTLLANWIMGVKMGLKGWELLVPLYGEFKYCEKVHGNGWYCLFLLLILIPIVGWIALFVLIIISFVKMIHKFGYRGWFVFGMICLNPVFSLIIALGDHSFEGQTADTGDYLYKGLLVIKEKIRDYNLKEEPVPEVAPGTCPGCGFVNDESSAFCSHCGTKLN